MWPFKRHQEPSQTISAAPESNPQDIAPQLSADELLLQSIEIFRERMRSVETRVREERHAAISDVQEKIEYSNQFIRRAGLDSALLNLLKEMWHWPAWIKRPDFEDHRRVELAELAARVRALARRHLGVARSLLEFGTLSLDTAHRECRIHGQRLALSVRELSVLEMLLVRAGKVVTKQQIVQGLSALDSDFSENAVEVYIYRLRKRLEGKGFAIQTVRGFGYLLATEAS